MSQSKGKPQAASHDHPTTATFVKVGIILFVITAIEFGIVYLEGVRSLVVTLLFTLSAVKFYLVATVFMHLKFEIRFLRWIFTFGVMLALLITLGLKFILKA